MHKIRNYHLNHKLKKKGSFRLSSLDWIKRDWKTRFSFLGRWARSQRIQNNFLKGMPPKVLEVFSNDMVSHYSGFTTLRQSNLRAEAVKEFPEYYPWDVKYAEIPEDVHEAYRREASPWMFTLFPEIEEKAFDGNNVSLGLIAEIENGGKSYSYGDVPFTKDTVLNWMTEMYKREEEKRIQEQEEKERDKALWDKHYKPYNLPYRD